VSPVRARAPRPVVLAVRLAPLLLAALAALVALDGACVKTGDSLGQSCLSNEDCFSGYCAGQICVSAPPVLDAEAMGDSAASGSDAADDATGEAAPPGDVSAESSAVDSPLVDRAGDASDASAPADAAGTDADASSSADGYLADGSIPAEAGADAPADVRLDVADGGG
jgi:hypothetical protein